MSDVAGARKLMERTRAEKFAWDGLTPTREVPIYELAFEHAWPPGKQKPAVRLAAPNDIGN